MRKLPMHEERFWECVREVVVNGLSDRCIPESWITAEHVPENFKDFMLGIYSDAFQSDEESYVAWCEAVIAVAKHLVGDKAGSVGIDILFDEPSLNGLPVVIVSSAKSFNMFAVDPDAVYDSDWQTLRQFLQSVAKSLSESIDNLEEVV